MTRYLFLRLSGGLGNQLFQVSAAFRLYQALGSDVCCVMIDDRFLSSYETRRTIEVDFILSDLFSGYSLNTKSYPLFSFLSRFRFGRILDRNIGEWRFIGSIAQLEHAVSSPGDSKFFLLDGYFQDPFVLYSEPMRIRLRDSILSSGSPLLPSLKQIVFGAVGVHIRRGDYVSSKAASTTFRVIPLQYYQSALQSIGNDKSVVVFSDDEELSASFAEMTGGVDVRQLRLSLQDEFRLLLACDDYVIANSTFSWWAAYFGNASSKRIYAPSRWYHDEYRNANNPLLLPSFHLIDV